MKSISLKVNNIIKTFNEGEKISIGRFSDNKIQLNDLLVSGHHGIIQHDDNCFTLSDLNSTNGIIVTRGSDRIYLSKASLQKCHLENKDRLKFGDQEIELSINEHEKINEIAGISINELVELENDDNQLLAKLNQFLFSIHSARSIEELFGANIRKVFDIISGGENLIVLLRDEWNNYTPIYSTNRDNTDQDISISYSIIQKIIEEKKAIIYDNVSSVITSSKSILEAGILNVLCVPVWDSNQNIIGVIQLDSRKQNKRFNQSDMNTLSLIGNYLGIAIDRIQYASNAKKSHENEIKLRKIFQRYVPLDIIKINLDVTENILVAQKRNVTVLFADLRKFTTFSENTNPVVVLKVLNEYFETMVDIIESHHGFVDKFIGDGIMVTFGSPISHFNDAYNAILTAVNMMKALNGLNSKWEREGLDEFKIGIGLHTGEVIAGNVGSTKRMEFTVIGDVVNTASRIEGITSQHPNKILMSEDTYNAVKVMLSDKFSKEFEIKKWNMTPLKGKVKNIQLYSIELK